MKKLIKSILSLFLMGIFSVSCGSGGVGGSGIVAGGGIGGTGVSQGTVTGFGSVIVNGVHFDVSGSKFTIDDDAPVAGFGVDDKKRPVTEAGEPILVEGMKVKVRVSDDLGRISDEITFEPDVEGPIDDIKPSENSLVVLGQTVVVDDSTNFEGTSGLTGDDSLAKLDRLEVSGFVFKDDKIQATHIRRVISAGTELKGTVRSLDTGAKTFLIGGQTVDFDSLTPPLTFELKEGDFVEVKGTRADSTSPLVADMITLEDRLGAKANDKVEIEGAVTTVTPAVTATIGAFLVDGQSVTTDSSTTFEDGAPDDILLNVRLEVEGTLIGGVLVARKVKFHGNRVKIEANVLDGDIDLATQTVTLLGIKVRINGATKLVSLSTFTDIVAGDRLEIRGYLSNGVVTATRVIQDNNKKEDPVVLQAPVDAGSVSGSIFGLHGVTVDTLSVGASGFQDLAGNIIDSTAFFLQLKDGTLVKAKGTFAINSASGKGTITASEVELED